MRILQVVTLMTPENVFGGPVTVAMNQSRELAKRGHHVVVAGGSRGYPNGSVESDGGVELRRFPVRQVIPGAGFSGIASLALLAYIRREARNFDVIHVHMARDLITLPAAAIASALGVPIVVQAHGMIDPSNRILAKPLDALMTRRVLRRAAAVFHLTPNELTDLQCVLGTPLENAQLLGNGVNMPGSPDLPAKPIEVLFCGRLQTRKRPVLFAEAAEALLAEGIEARFRLVGADEGEGPAVQQVIDRVGRPDMLTWEGAVAPQQVLEHMTDASVFVLPAVDEPYPMAVIEAMSLGRPVIITDTCGLAPIVEQSESGLVTDRSFQALVDAIRLLVQDSALRAKMALQATEACRVTFSIAGVAEGLERAYAGVRGNHPN